MQQLFRNKTFPGILIPFPIKENLAFLRKLLEHHFHSNSLLYIFSKHSTHVFRNSSITKLFRKALNVKQVRTGNPFSSITI